MKMTIKRLLSMTIAERQQSIHAGLAGSKMGRGTEWIKENRRRRAAGLPQLRA